MHYSHHYIDGGTRLTCWVGDFTQKVLSESCFNESLLQ